MRRIEVVMEPRGGGLGVCAARRLYKHQPAALGQLGFATGSASLPLDTTAPRAAQTCSKRSKNDR